MLKAEIISKTLNGMNLALPAQESYSDEPEYEEDVIKTLETRLPDVDIKTCQDFKHLNVECCETCHEFYPHYDMSLIELPDGRKGWVCDAVRWAIYPEEYQRLKDTNSEMSKLLRQVFGEDAEE